MTATSLVCYDLETVSRFFRSAAIAVAYQRHTRLEWETYRDSKVLNAVYAVFFWKEPPGTAEIRTSGVAEIQRTVNEFHSHFLHTWINRLSTDGPSAAQTYVSRIEGVREAAREATQEVFRSASSINNEVIGRTGEAIQDLARIKLAATVGVAVIGAAAGIAFAAAAVGGGAAAGGITVLGLNAGASSAAFGLTSFGYSAANSVVKTWEQANSAKVAAISMDTAKYVGNEVSDRLASNALARGLHDAQHSEQIIQSANGLIRQHSERLAQDTLKKAARNKSRDIVSRSTGQIAAQTARNASAVKTVAGASAAKFALPVVFAAWDIVDAWSEYQETTASLR